METGLELHRGGDTSRSWYDGVVRAVVLFAACLSCLTAFASSQSRRPNPDEQPWLSYTFGGPEGDTPHADPPVCETLGAFGVSLANLVPLSLPYQLTPGSPPADAVSLVGNAQGRNIYVAMLGLHAISDDPDDPRIAASERKLLVSRGDALYCMISDQVDGDPHLVGSADMVTVGDAPILSTLDIYDGNTGAFLLQAWVFDHGEPYHLDFKAPDFVKLLPKGCTASRDGEQFNVEKLEDTFLIRSPADAHTAHGYSCGTVWVKYRIQGHQATIAEQRYNPPAPR